MSTLSRKLTIIVIIGACAITHDTSAMQKFAKLYYSWLEQKKRKPDYSINLMWINKERKEDQQFIHPLPDEFVSTIGKWAVLNKNGVVNVWYDAEMTTADAIKNTKGAINQECLQYPEKAPVVLKNVRKLPEVKEHPKVFSDQMPIYFRVDLLRAIAGFNHISRNKVNYFVYSDLDAEPISEDKLFDEKTKEDLKQYGMVMAQIHPGSSGYENGFQIISNHKPNLLQAKKFALIDLNIKRAYEHLNGEQEVYHSYHNMFAYFYYLEGCGKFLDWSTHKDWEPCDGQAQRLKEFSEKTIIFRPEQDWCRHIKRPRDMLIPTKDVNLPPSEAFGCNSHKS